MQRCQQVVRASSLPAGVPSLFDRPQVMSHAIIISINAAASGRRGFANQTSFHPFVFTRVAVISRQNLVRQLAANATSGTVLRCVNEEILRSVGVVDFTGFSDDGVKAFLASWPADNFGDGFGNIAATSIDDVRRIVQVRNSFLSIFVLQPV